MLMTLKRDNQQQVSPTAKQVGQVITGVFENTCDHLGAELSSRRELVSRVFELWLTKRKEGR